jgi:hypothetical protein
MLVYESLDHVSFDNGTSIELAVRDGEFLGVGEVMIKGTRIRSGRRPWFVNLRSPDGVAFTDFRVVQIERLASQGVAIHLLPSVLASDTMEWMVHEVRPRYNTTDWTAIPRKASGTRLVFELSPVNRVIAGVCYAGFSYRFQYRSDEIALYKIVDRGTWEVGGRSLGNEFWMRNCFAPAITRFDRVEQSYSTEWYLPSATNPYVFQFLPLQTELQGFSFTASDEGTLVTWATDVAHIRSLFEKKPGIDEIEHWHEHCGDLAHEFSTSEVEVLFGPGVTEIASRANTYETIRSFV